MRRVRDVLLDRFMLFLIALVAATPLRATAQQVDVELVTTLTPGTALAPGTEARLALTVRNNGPADLSANGIGATVQTSQFLVDGPGENIVVFPLAETAPCSFFVDTVDPIPGDAIPTTALVRFPPLAAGESKTCVVGVAAQQDATGTFDLLLTVTKSGADVVETDPANNQRSYRILMSNVAPTPVPAVGILTTLLLALSVAAVAAWSMHHEATVVRPNLRRGPRRRIRRERSR